ncbi:hypothetical protein Tco_0217676 [Tanacetum coccineum]
MMDEIVAGDQPYAEDASPMAHSPDDVPESDHEEDRMKDDDEDPEEDPIDYSADGGDDGDDEMDIEEDEDADMDIDEEDEDDEMDDEEAEEEHSAPAYPEVVCFTSFRPICEEYRASITVPAWSILRLLRLLAYLSPPASPISMVFIHHHRFPYQYSPFTTCLALGHGYEVERARRCCCLATSGGHRADYGFVATYGQECQLMETEAGLSKRAWRRALDSSDIAMEGFYLGPQVYAQLEEITEPQEAGGDERAESCRPHSTAADCSDLDCCTDTTEGDGSTTGTGRHTAGAGDRLTGTGDDITGTGYYITGTAGTAGGLAQAGAAERGW